MRSVLAAYRKVTQGICRIWVRYAAMLLLVASTAIVGRLAATSLMSQSFSTDQATCFEMNWTALGDQLSWQYVPDYHEYDAQLSRVVRSEKFKGEYHSLVYFTRIDGPELVNYRNEKRPAGKWLMERATDLGMVGQRFGDEKGLAWRTFAAEQGQLLFVWWYNIGGAVTTSDLGAKLLGLIQMFESRRDSSFNAIAVPCGYDCSAEQKAVAEFIEYNSEILDPVQVCRTTTLTALNVSRP